MASPLPRSFYLRPVLKVAPDLIGKIFHRRLGDQILRGIIVETEAYHQIGDASCHAARGVTARNEVMFGRGGLLYVYFTYGVHHCMNVVCEPEGTAAAVLIRALQPVSGEDVMRKNRMRSLTKNKKLNRSDLTSGPGKVCQALKISRDDNGIDLVKTSSAWITENPGFAGGEIIASERIGITKDAHLPWRFLLAENGFVSDFRKNRRIQK